jgi:hypothetical protein
MKSVEKMACSFDSALRGLIFEVYHGLLWGFLPRGDLKKNRPD